MMVRTNFNNKQLGLYMEAIRLYTTKTKIQRLSVSPVAFDVRGRIVAESSALVDSDAHSDLGEFWSIFDSINKNI